MTVQKWPVLFMGVGFLLLGCQSAPREYSRPECPLTITLKWKFFQNADEVELIFGPPTLKSIKAYDPGPKAFRAVEPPPNEMGKLESTTVTYFVRSRGYTIDFDLPPAPEGVKYGMFGAWEGLMWRDAFDHLHLPAGWYQIRILYEPLNYSPTYLCAAISAPFYIATDTVFYPPDEIQTRGHR